MEFMTTKAWQRFNLADGQYRYEETWHGSHLFNDVMISFQNDDGDLLLKVVLSKTMGRRFFTKWVAWDLIELEY
jgi:hypothetical protein